MAVWGACVNVFFRLNSSMLDTSNTQYTFTAAAQPLVAAEKKTRGKLLSGLYGCSTIALRYQAYPATVNFNTVML